MNPNHLTPNVRKQVVEAIKELRIIKKEPNSLFQRTGHAFETEEEIEKFFRQYYEKCKDEIENKYGAFLELITLEDKYGFVGGYLGGANLNTDGDTIIKIGQFVLAVTAKNEK